MIISKQTFKEITIDVDNTSNTYFNNEHSDTRMF